MSQLKTMTQKWFDEMEIFELPTVVLECPTEAAEAVTDLRKEVRTLLAELTKEREANSLFANPKKLLEKLKVYEEAAYEGGCAVDWFAGVGGELEPYALACIANGNPITMTGFIECVDRLAVDMLEFDEEGNEPNEGGNDTK